MIIERKQYGAVTVLFVQIGLALYVIVVFLAQGANGAVNPKILKVQKVGVAQSAHTLRLESGTNTVSNLESASLDSQILALIAPDTTQALPEIVISLHPQGEIEEVKSTDIFNTGSKPRAPTIA